jgi:aspartyl-tRNA(Asn)/glutamyl-tRNA(Gln) amidotransferase subunit A
MPELAYGPLNAYHYGPTRNPWDPTRFSGGSSMGAAAALAAGLVPGAVGSDTGGSIRHPAAWSGVSGLKPTYGRVPLRGVVPLALSLDHVGPMARSAEDCALLLSVLAGHDRADPTSADVPVPDYVGALTRPVRGLRLGVPRGPFFEDQPPDIARALSAARRVLESLGLTACDVDVPEWEAAVAAAHVLIRCEAAAEYRAALRDRPADLLPEVRERLSAGLATPAPDYVDALRTARRLGTRLDEIFRQVDVLLTPARDQVAPRMDDGGRLLEPLSRRSYASPLNLVGLPALAIPCGADPRGLPIGLQLAGRAWEEATLLGLAHAFQQVTDWHRRRPPLGDA